MIFLMLAILLYGNINTVGKIDSTITDTTRHDKTQFMVLPILFSSPDTRMAFGVLPQIVFRTSSSSNPSSIRLDSYYTQNRQYHILLRPVFWLNDNSWSLSGKLSFKKWPTSFYGIGNNTLSDAQEKFTETLYESSFQATRRISSDYYAGINYSFRKAAIDPINNTGVLSTDDITGSRDNFISAPGLVLKKDTRDNHFYPAEGSYHTLEISSSLQLLGSDFSFTRFRLDLRRYISIKQPQVLALQGVLSVSTGDLPFRMLSSVGSTLRGYSTVRYIDRNLVTFQAEYRVAPLFWRLGFVTFAGVGDVFDNAGDLHINKLKFSAGIGIRYLFSRSEKINIRLDYGLGKDSSGDYIDLNEAF